MDAAIRAAQNGGRMNTRMWIAAAVAALLPLTARAEADKKTERTWKAKCASCHGADGKGQTDQGQKLKVADLSSASWQKSQTDAQIKTVIENGTKNASGGEMDGYKDKLDGEQIDALVAYVRSLK
jgi:mono/diheme cytochrome c family protein